MSDQRMIHRFHSALGGAATGRKRKPFPRRWTAEETERAAAMHAKGMTYREIGQSMRRSEGSVAAHLKEPGVGIVHPNGSANFSKPTDDMIAAMEARREASDARDITGTLCGDPPIGFSALDRYDTSLVDETMRKAMQASADE